MAYNTSTGSREFDDMRYEQDRDTQIDWGQDSISFKTNDITRVVIDNSAISASGDATFVGATVVGSTFNVSGNVGIGTDSADGKLHVMKSSAGSVTVVGQQANGIIVEDDDSTAITLLDPNGGVIYFGDADDTDIGRIGYRHGGDYANSLYFTTNNAQRMTIDSSGKLGIGTSTPTETLTVVGDVSGSGTFQIVGATTLGSTLSVSGAISGSNALSAVGAITTAGGLNLQSSGITNAGAIAGATNISGSGTLQMVGNVFLGSDVAVSGTIEFEDPATILDNAGSGEVAKFGLGTLTTGKLYYLHTNSTWTEVDADAIATGADQLLGIALGSSATTNGLLLRGYFDATTYLSNFSAGKAVYISTTAASMNTTAPSTSGDFVRVVGYCTNTANVIYFNPSGDWVEL